MLKQIMWDSDELCKIKTYVNTVLDISMGLFQPDMSMDFKKKVFDYIRAANTKLTFDDIDIKGDYQKYLAYWDDILTRSEIFDKKWTKGLTKRIRMAKSGL